MNVVNDESEKVWDEVMAFDLPGKLLLVGLPPSVDGGGRMALG